MRSVVVQKAVLTNARGEILLLRRSKTDIRRPLQWDLPGGLVDPGEDLISSIRREVKEESGQNVDTLTLVYATTEVRNWNDHEGDHTDNVTFLFYTASSKTEDVAISYEHDKYQWVGQEAVTQQLEYDLHIRALDYILSNNLLSKGL